MLVAELDDLRRGDGADALDRVELLDRRRAEADRAAAGAGVAPGGRRPALRGRNLDLLAVGERRGEVDRVGARRPRPARRRARSRR